MIVKKIISSILAVVLFLNIISFNYNKNISIIVISEPISSKLGATHDKNIDENDHMQSNQSVSEILTLIRLDNKNYYYYNNLDYTYNFLIIVRPR